MATKNKVLTEDQKREIRGIVRKQILTGFLTILALLGGITGLSLWEIYKQVKESTEKKVEYLVADQFKEPKIQVIVEKAAENQAVVLMSNQINPEVDKFQKDIESKTLRAEGKLSELDFKIKDANESIKDLKTCLEYYSVVLAAQAESRPAYDLLLKWSNDSNFPFKESAFRTYAKIMDDHSTFDYLKDFEFPWKPGLDPSKLTLEQLKKTFSELNQYPYWRRALLEYIYKRTDISKYEKLDFFIDVLRNDKDLMVCEYASRYFKELTGLKKKTLAFDAFFDWWAANKGKFEPNSQTP